MCNWMKSVNSRLASLESRLGVSDAGKIGSPVIHTPSHDGSNIILTSAEHALKMTKKRSDEFHAQRKIILEFNEDQLNKINAKDPDDPPFTWTSDKNVEYQLVEDMASLAALTKSDMNPGNISATFPKTLRVVIINNKLVPISREFKDGVGASYVWTPDDKLAPPALVWRYDKRKGQSKKYTDPRIGIMDPRTSKLWEPDEEETRETDEEISQKADESAGEVVCDFSDSESDSEEDSDLEEECKEEKMPDHLPQLYDIESDQDKESEKDEEERKCNGIEYGKKRSRSFYDDDSGDDYVNESSNKKHK